MATQLFFRAAVSDYSTGNNDARIDATTGGWLPTLLSTARGVVATSIVTPTVAGPTAGIETAYPSPWVWYSLPLDADITISGSITWNLRSAESSMSANVAINGRLEKIDGATGAITLIDQTARTTELGTSEAAVNFAETPAAGVACKRGDRLRVRVFGDDAGTMASTYTFTFWFDGAVAALTGDSYLTLTENLTFVSEPAGSQVFPTNTASDVATASVDREAWTSRGAGVQTDVTNTVAGWTAPIQVTDAAGGTVVDWFTKPLTAFTLGGAVRCNVRMDNPTTKNLSPHVQIDVCEADGSNPVLWAIGQTPVEVGASETAFSFLVAGDDLAVTAGQRLRIRFLIDDVATDPMTGGSTATLYYAGTSGGASGDSYLTFTQTLTEYVAGTNAAAGVATGTGAAEF